MKKVVNILIILGVTMLLTSCKVGSAKYENITAQEAKELMDNEENYVILDVRTLDEYNSGHIENAILIPNDEINDLNKFGNGHKLLNWLLLVGKSDNYAQNEKMTELSHKKCVILWLMTRGWSLYAINSKSVRYILWLIISTHPVWSHNYQTELWPKTAAPQF